MPDLATRLAERTLELVNIPSESRHEAEIAAYVRDAVGSPAWDEDDTLWYGRRPQVVLAGHFDTVPAQGNVPGSIEDGAVVGLGASDMKGGVAVMIELAQELGDEVGFLFFPARSCPPPRAPCRTSLTACPMSTVPSS